MKDNPKPAAGGQYILDPVTNRPVPATPSAPAAAAPSGLPPAATEETRPATLSAAVAATRRRRPQE